MDSVAAHLLGAKRMRILADIGFRAARDDVRQSMSLLREIVPADAWELVTYDSDAGTHQTLALDGYTRLEPQVGAVLYPSTASYRRVIDRRAPVRLDEPGSRFADSAYFRTYLRPYGWRAGLTAPLFLQEGRYTGLLHMSAYDPHAFDAQTSATVAALSTLLARLTDARRCTGIESLPEDCCALAYGQDGPDAFGRPVAGLPHSAALAAEPAMAGLAREFLATHAPRRRGLWQDHAGEWRELRLVRCAFPGRNHLACAVLAERRITVPHGLTRREIDVLTLLAQGHSNHEIAARLLLSVRTVTTHLEHLFDKTGCHSRLQAALTARREGLTYVGPNTPRE